MKTATISESIHDQNVSKYCTIHIIKEVAEVVTHFRSSWSLQDSATLAIMQSKLAVKDVLEWNRMARTRVPKIGWICYNYANGCDGGSAYLVYIMRPTRFSGGKLPQISVKGDPLTIWSHIQRNAFSEAPKFSVYSMWWIKNN